MSTHLFGHGDIANRDGGLPHALLDDGSPLAEAVAVLVKAAVRAAQISPEWANHVVGETSPRVDQLAQHLVRSRI